MSSFNILAKETILESRLFLEASAGTGKTFAIEHLVVRLLVETTATLEEILVVTFTRAATRELRERIRANLEKAIQGESFDYLKGLNGAQLEKIKTAFLTFEKAQIFTIHGFCQRLLQEFAFEASVGLDLSEWTSEEETWAILEFLRRTTCVSPQQLRRLFGKYQNDIELVIQKLKRSTQKPEVDLLSAINSELAQLSFFPLAELFNEIRSEYKGMTSPEFQSQAELLQEALRRKELLPDEFDKLVGEEDLFLECLTTSELKVRAKISHPPQLKEFRDRLWPLLERARDPYQILQIVASGWHQEKKRLARLHEKISPDDLLEMVQERLSDSAFVSRIREKYQTVIVDEFQDTDPIQWNIFNELFVQDAGKSIYLVGDPKQSIYAFRKADIYTFLQAGELFPKKAALTTNYRSGPQLISALNQLFCSKPWLDLPKLEQTLIAHPVQAAKQEGGELCFMVAEGEIGRSKRWPTPDIERALFFPFIVHEMIRLGLLPGEVAILVKDRYQALRVKDYLQQWKIPSVLNRDVSLGESIAIDLIEEVLEACFGTNRVSMVKRVMIGPLFETPIEELTDEFVFNTQMVFSELAAVWIEKGIAAFFAQLLDEEVTRRLHSQALYNDVMLVLEKIIFIQDPHLAIKTLHELRLNESEDRISAHPNGVQIMTVHASKGLEFETVFALGIASRTPAEESQSTHELDAEKMRQLYVALTRAKTRLYVPLLNETSGKEPASGEASPIELFWKKVTPNLTQFSHIFLNRMEFILKPFEQKLSPTIPSCLPLNPSFPPIYLQSFSSLAMKGEWKAVEDSTLPPGVETGIIIHAIMERYFEERQELKTIIDRETRGTHLELYQETLRSLLEKVLDLSLGSFTLRQITNVFPEMEFLFPSGDAYLKGFIDLCIEYEGKYYLIDWKTNVLEDYSPQTIEKAMIDNDYLLQGKIYTEALQRYLHIFGDLPIGGIFFIFIRGPAFYALPSTN